MACMIHSAVYAHRVLPCAPAVAAAIAIMIVINTNRCMVK